MPKRISIVFEPEEAAFLTQHTGHPLSAAAVRDALRQWAIWTLSDVGDLFLPRDRAANVKAINADSERKSHAKKTAWSKRSEAERKAHGEKMRAGRKKRQVKQPASE